MQMHGQIRRFHNEMGVGIIRAEDGRHYRFARSEIVNSTATLEGTDVDFVVVQRQPRQIFLMAGSPWAAFGGSA